MTEHTRRKFRIDSVDCEAGTVTGVITHSTDRSHIGNTVTTEDLIGRRGVAVQISGSDDIELLGIDPPRLPSQCPECGKCCHDSANADWCCPDCGISWNAED